MIWVILYVAYALIQGALVVRGYNRYCYTPMRYPEDAHSVLWAALFAPVLTALMIATFLEFIWDLAFA